MRSAPVLQDRTRDPPLGAACELVTASADLVAGGGGEAVEGVQRLRRSLWRPALCIDAELRKRSYESASDQVVRGAQTLRKQRLGRRQRISEVASVQHGAPACGTPNHAHSSLATRGRRRSGSP